MFGIRVEAEIEGEMIYIVNEDAPGFIGRLGTALGEAGVKDRAVHRLNATVVALRVKK